MQDATLIVPCFNEERRLRADAFLGLAREPGVKLLFVDDGSRDGTAARLEEFRREVPDRISWFSQQNKGKAEAVRAGLIRALDDGAAFVGFLDADLATPAEEALRLVEEARRTGVDAVLGSRVALLGRRIERTPVRHLTGRVFATAASLILRLRVYDTQCGAKVFRASDALRHALADPFLSRWAFDVELIGRLLTGGPGVAPLEEASFVEVPLRTWVDVAGSKLTPAHMVRSAMELGIIARDLARRRGLALAAPAPGQR